MTIRLNPLLARDYEHFYQITLKHYATSEFKENGRVSWGFSPEDNPLVGELPGYPGEHIIAGYTSHGMPIAFGAGRAIAQLIIGEPPQLPLSFSSARLEQLK